jgi:hypothetical protein
MDERRLTRKRRSVAPPIRTTQGDPTLHRRILARNAYKEGSSSLRWHVLRCGHRCPSSSYRGGNLARMLPRG